MKKILILLLLTLSFSLISTSLIAQTEREILLKLSEKVDKIAEQQIETNKQIAVINTKLEGIDKRFEAVDKRFDDSNKRMDMLFYMMMAMLTAIFGLIGFVVWDRQASIKPILEENAILKKEIDLIKDRETKLEEKQLINERFFKKLIEKYPDLANIN